MAHIEARIETVHKLSTVISAMRGIAAARVAEAHDHLDSIRRYAATIGAGIGTLLAGDGAPPAAHGTDAAGPGRPVIIVIGAEQGFAGGYNDRILARAAPLLTREATLLAIGDRARLALAERGTPADWDRPMIAHPAQATALAGRIGAELFARLSAGGGRPVWMVHARPGAGEGAEARPLFPFDYARFPAPRRATPPLRTLPSDLLLARLVEEYVLAELGEAIMLAFAAENEARMRAMIAAHDNVAASLGELVATARRLRQDEITGEIVELASSGLPGR